MATGIVSMTRRRMWFVVVALGAFALLTSMGAASGSSWVWGTFTGPAVDETERVVRVGVRVEVATGHDTNVIARTVSDILIDHRGWQDSENVVFQVVADGSHDLVISVATPATTDSRCLPLRTVGKLSCRNGDEVILNVDRWERGPDVYHSGYEGALDEYRRYLVNHEVGHYLGKGHVYPSNCSSMVRAPVMMQQTFGLRGCAINGWPALDYAPAGPTALQANSIAAAVRHATTQLRPWRFVRNQRR